MNPLLISLIILAITAIWLYISFMNYINTLNVIRLYEEMINDLTEAEKKEEDTFQKAFIFNKRETLINNNLATEQMRIELAKNKEMYKLKLFASFLVLGPFYNLK